MVALLDKMLEGLVVEYVPDRPPAPIETSKSLDVVCTGELYELGLAELSEFMLIVLLASTLEVVVEYVPDLPPAPIEILKLLDVLCPAELYGAGGVEYDKA